MTDTSKPIPAADVLRSLLKQSRHAFRGKYSDRRWSRFMARLIAEYGVRDPMEILHELGITDPQMRSLMLSVEERLSVLLLALYRLAEDGKLDEPLRDAADRYKRSG